MRSDDRDLCDSLTRWAEQLETGHADDLQYADTLYAAAARIEQMSATIAEIERLRAIVAEVNAAVHGFETGDAENIIDRVRRAVHEEVQP